MTLVKKKYLAYLIVARQCLKVLLVEAELLESVLTNLLSSSVVCVEEILAIRDCRIANGNTCLELEAALVRMANFDEPGEDISFPCFVQWMVEVLDVSLEEPQFSLQADGVNLQLRNLVLDAVVSGFQSKLGGVESLSTFGVSLKGHDGKHEGEGLAEELP